MLLLPPIELPGVHILLVLATRRWNLRPHLVTLLDCAVAMEFFSSGAGEQRAKHGAECPVYVHERYEFAARTCIYCGQGITAIQSATGGCLGTR